MFRVDQPEIPEAEEVLMRSEYTHEGSLPKGSIVRRAKIEAACVLVGSQSIYRITPCTEEAAIAAIRMNVPRPMVLVSLPVAVALSAPEPEDYEMDDEDGPL